MGDLSATLKDFFQKAKLPVLFAGSGVSARAGLPTWANYLSGLGAAAGEYDIYTKYMVDRAIAKNALGDAAAYYMMCSDMPEATKLKELAAPLESFQDQELSSLVKLPFQSVVTTNFDRALFAAYAKHAGTAAEEVNIDDPTLDAAVFSDHLYIARIHGRVEIPHSMRLSTDALAELEKNPSYQRFIEHIFTRRQVLFVGFSFLDPAIESVLRAIRRITKSLHGQEHLALVPKGAPAELTSELELHSIRRIEYDPTGRHDELWDGIQSYAEAYAASPRHFVDVREQPFIVAKKYLATAYARARIGREREPLAQAVVEGIVSGIIQAAGEAGVSENKLVEQLQSDLSFDKSVAQSLVAQAATSLARSGVCKIDPEEGVARYFAARTEVIVYDQAIARLVDGTIQRYAVLERGDDSTAGRIFLTDLFGNLLLTRGWELGAAFAARKMPDDVNIADVARGTKCAGLSSRQVEGLVRGVESLLARPDDDEVKLLAELGKTAFGLELLLEAPHDAVFLQRTLPERIYFDTNVIMPAITVGHPHHDLFNATIDSLREAAGTAILDVSLRVYDGFLNEIVSHKQLARDAMMAQGGEGELWEARAVSLYGSGNVNVFVGAYFNYRESHPAVSFDEFLRVAAPYNNETDLRRHLEQLGFQVVRSNQVQQLASAEILHALEKYYSNMLEANRKSATVIRHDATQLAILNAELQGGVRTMFVSADRGIRFALEYEGYSNISNSMMTHLGLAQLVELLIGRLPAARGLVSLLWMSRVSDDTSRIRNHLIALALKEHDAALSMAMSDLVNEISEDAGMELSRKRLHLDAENENDRREVNQTLERYESSFFQKMHAEAMRIRDRFN